MKSKTVGYVVVEVDSEAPGDPYGLVPEMHETLDQARRRADAFERVARSNPQHNHIRYEAASILMHPREERT
jgi:hypothetical protein